MNRLYYFYSMLYWKYISKIKCSAPSVFCKNDKKLHIIANGPSANNVFDQILAGYINADDDFLCVNRMLLVRTEEIFRVQPKYYVTVDPMFWGEKLITVELEDMYKQFVSTLEEITWDMYLITSPYSTLKLKNQHIKFIYLSPVICKRMSNLTSKMLKRNMCTAGMDNVALAAIYFGITWGYKNIKLYGMDYDWVKSIYVSEDNKLYTDTNHAHEKKAFNEHQFTTDPEGEVVAYWKRCIETYRCFNLLSKYAKHEGCFVQNMNKNSLLDMFCKTENGKI